MNILYLSCHSILEHDELSMFHELGHNFFSLHGSYQNPRMPGDPKRPLIDVPANQELMDCAIQCTKENIHDKILDWADVCVVMHRADWIVPNLDRMQAKGVKVVLRTIGQSIEHWEKGVYQDLKKKGVKIVRYSPMEKNIPGYCGEDAIIRFGVDKNIYQGWTGGSGKVHVFGQSIKGRGDFLNFGIIDEITKGLPRAVYGPKNEDIEWSGGELTPEDLIKKYQQTDVALYAGTIPASYTLTFIEMMLMGVPIVALGSRLFNCEGVFPNHNLYEIPAILNGQNGVVSDNPDELRQAIRELLVSQTKRMVMNDKARQTAFELFDKDKIKLQWKSFLESL